MKHALIALALIALPTVASAERIDLPGSVFGGAEICDMQGKCSTTADDRETPATILEYVFDGNASYTLVRIAGRNLKVLGNQVGLHYRSCDLTLRSYLTGSFCPQTTRDPIRRARPK